ncbi:hypothetical protein KKC88_03760 [Patescibacteria group bacterium]|nr:hypothetical protein [Patescibacteria group bacterium]MBU1673379.1 hypothetical protein [Patescibacteria group bacterium]MBU1963453.1 hypothetical protein [Patescibacteria group bacterium]
MKHKYLLILSLFVAAVPFTSYADPPDLTAELTAEGYELEYLPSGVTLEALLKIRAENGLLLPSSSVEVAVNNADYRFPTQVEKSTLSGTVIYINPVTLKLRMSARWVNDDDKVETTGIVCILSIGEEEEAGICFVFTSGGSTEEPIPVQSTRGPIHVD